MKLAAFRVENKNRSDRRRSVKSDLPGELAQHLIAARPQNPPLLSVAIERRNCRNVLVANDAEIKRHVAKGPELAHRVFRVVDRVESVLMTHASNISRRAVDDEFDFVGVVWERQLLSDRPQRIEAGNGARPRLMISADHRNQFLAQRIDDALEPVPLMTGRHLMRNDRGQVLDVVIDHVAAEHAMQARRLLDQAHVSIECRVVDAVGAGVDVGHEGDGVPSAFRLPFDSAARLRQVPQRGFAHCGLVDFSDLAIRDRDKLGAATVEIGKTSTSDIAKPGRLRSADPEIELSGVKSATAPKVLKNSFLTDSWLHFLP